MHDTDNHYFDVRQTHDTRMEYVRKTGRHGMFTIVCVNQAETIPTNKKQCKLDTT